MRNSNIDSHLHSIRDSPTLRCPPDIYSELEGLESSDDFSPHFLHLISYSLSRFNLFRNTGCVSLSSALSPAAPQEHYAHPCFVSLYKFLGCEPEGCAAPIESPRPVQNQDTDALVTQPGPPICTQTANEASASINNLQGVVSTSDSETETTSDSEGLSTNQQTSNKNRPKSYAELHLRHLKRSIPRLKSTKYANLHLLHALSRPVICPNIILVEDTGGCGVASFLRSMCHRVSNVYSNPSVQSLFSTVYSTVIGEKQCSSMAHRSLQMQCCNDNLSSDFTNERVLSTIQESKRIIRLFNRREKQKDGTWGKKPRKSPASPSESITQALQRAKAAIQKKDKSNKAEQGELEYSNGVIVETRPDDKQSGQRCSSPSPSESSLSIQNRDSIIAYFSYLSNYPTLAWNPITVIDFSPIQYDVSTFDICSEIGFNLGSIHKEAGTTAAKRSILIGYNKYRFSYRRQLFRARLFYNILSKSSVYKLDSDKYYYNSLNDCMDLHIEQDAVERRQGLFNPLSLHTVLCGTCEEEMPPDKIVTKTDESTNTTQPKKVTEPKRDQKKGTKSSSKYSILDQIAKSAQKPSLAIDGEGKEPTRKQPSSTLPLSTDAFFKLFIKTMDPNMDSLQHTRRDISAPSLINGRGLPQHEYSVINDNITDSQVDLPFVSVPLCEISPFNCSHLFMLKDMTSDIAKYKAMACEALILVSYNTASWKMSSYTLSLRPDIRQLSNLIHFWGDTVNMPLAPEKRSVSAQSNNIYADVVESCSSLCSGFLSLSGSSHLSLYRNPAEQDACMVSIENSMSGERILPAVRYALLSQRGLRRRYRIDFVPETRQVSPEIEEYISYLETLDRDAMCHSILPNLDQRGMYSDILLANGEVMARRVTDTIHMVLTMANYGAPDNVFRGIDILQKEHGF